MDASSTPQTVAQAVQAATQQQSQQLSAPSPPVQAPAAQSSTIDNLTCQWSGCGERCDTAESLYDHVCERHVGRKSTNNLNLTCQWGACRTTTVKRDHITSHIRVHVPLKPHKCDFCGKAFKRPQDLKKHVKTHADDSVLMNSPSQGNARASMGASGISQQNGKPSGYYPASHDGGLNPYPSYQPAMGGAAPGGMGAYPPQAATQYAGYGSVNYPNSSLQDIQSMDTRRRAIEALNDFLGDIKRRAIDPQNYYDVGHRLQSSALPLPVGGGYNTGYSNSGGYSNYNTASLLEAFSGNMGGGGGGGGAGPTMHGPGVASQGYSLPLPNARTKNDLQDIDRFLEQLQATVYETSNHSAAAGVQQPGVHAMHTGEYGFGGHQSPFRSSNSPPSSFGHGSGGISGVNGISNVGMGNVPASTSALDTPALTPASMSSYSSAQSPMSSHSRSSLSSQGGNQMYPNLPSVTGMSDLGAGYPTTTSAPASGLSSGFEGLDGRRYSGGRLQRVAPGQDTEMADADDGSRTPKASDATRPKSKGNSSIDPALRGEGDRTPSDSAGTPAAETGDDKRQEEWVENIRVIEALKKWVSDRLKNGEYEDAEAEAGAAEDAKGDDADKAAALAKMVEERLTEANMADEKPAEEKIAQEKVAEEKMADADEDVKYPTLPSGGD